MRIPFRSILLFSSLICFSSLEALPSGCEVISGDVKVNSGSDTLTITSGDKTILHWKDFSIGKGEVTQFWQTDKHSAVLNRVTGGLESKIYGSLESNGKLYFINPSGICVGPDARIETTGFLASTLDVLNEAFLANKELLFSGDSMSSVRNLGTISCPSGDITLIARFVKNEGDLLAPNGVVSMASAPEVLLQLEGKERIYIRPTLTAESTEDGQSSLEHTGKIEALAVELKSGSNPYRQAIKCSGSVKGISTTEENGHIYIVAEKGTTEITGSLIAKQGDKGGEVRVLGEQVLIQESASIDVSGNTSGGQVLLGGDYQGANPDIQNAQLTWVGKDTKINADALVDGDGGRVILWGDQTTGFFGTISAQGGQNSGNGGFIEISSLGELLPVGQIDTSSLYGKCGTLLLDPTNVTLSTVADTNIVVASPPLYRYSGTPANINIAALVGFLATANVVINTDNPTSQGDEGSITVSNAITWATSNTLTLIANKNIIINAPITNTVGGTSFTALECIAHQTRSTVTPPTGFFNGIEVNGVAITTTSGDIFMQGTGGDDVTRNIGIYITNTLTSALVTSTTGNITLIGQASPVKAIPTITVNNYGVAISGDAGVTSTVSTGGNILIKGVGGDGAGGGTTGNIGVRIADNAFVTSSKSIEIIGQGGGNAASSGNVGIVLQSGVHGPAVVNATGTGTILMEGTGGTGPQASGISIANPPGINIARVQTVSGDMNLIGHGGGDADIGVLIDTDSLVTSGAGNILIHGTAVGTDTNFGVFNVSSITTTAGGNIHIIGESRATGIGNPGVGVDGGIVSAAGTGSILMEGVGGPGTQNNLGIGIVGSSSVTTASGNIHLVGTGRVSVVGAGTTGNMGIEIDTSQVTSTGAGSILLEGIGGAGTSNNTGVQVSSTSLVGTTNAGDIHIIGRGNGTGAGDSNRGVHVTSTSQVQVTGVGATGNILIEGIAGNGNGITTALSCDGIRLESTSTVSAVDGGIRMVGTANGSGQNNSGIYIANSSQVLSTGSSASGSSIILEGNATPLAGTGINMGVRMELSQTAVQSTRHDIEIIGYGAYSGTGTFNHGIAVGIPFGTPGPLTVPVNIVSASGNITLTGYGGGGDGNGGSGAGIVMGSLGGLIQTSGVSTSGTIEIYGEGRGASSPGIFIDRRSKIVTATGNIGMTGISKGTSSGNQGIYLHGPTATVQATGTNNGTIVLTGIGSAQGTNSNQGILLDGGAAVQSSGGAGAASITLTGIGQGSTNGNTGIELDTGSIASSGVGTTNTIHISGRSSGLGINNRGVYIHNAGSQITSAAQNIRIYAESASGTSEALTLDSGNVTITTTASLIDIVTRGNGLTGGDLLLQNGSNIATIGGPIQIDAGGNLTLTGGTLANQATRIANTNGATTISIGGNLTLTGGSGSKAFAQIGDNANGANGNILFPSIGGNVTLTGDSYAVIGYGSTATRVGALTGDITFQRIGGNLNINGATVNPATEGFAQIGHISPTVGPTVVDLSGDIFLNVVGNINITGGTPVAGTYAQLGHGPATAFATFTGTGSVNALAGNNITMTGNTGRAYIVNFSTTALGTYPGSGNITLVVDNNNPLNAFAGGTGFFKDANSFITNVLTGQVRIYTVAQGLNGLNGQTINSYVFNQGASGIDSTYEKFGIWYGAGEYANPPVVVYYKTARTLTPCGPCPDSPCVSTSTPFFPVQEDMAVASAQSFDLLSRWNGMLTVGYHGQVCNALSLGSRPVYLEGISQPCAKSEKSCLNCEPGFERFESFIFENTVDRVLPLGMN